jgi:hypothetical protein
MNSYNPIVPNTRIVKENNAKISSMRGISETNAYTSSARAGSAFKDLRGRTILKILTNEIDALFMLIVAKLTITTQKSNTFQ